MEGPLSFFLKQLVGALNVYYIISFLIFLTKCQAIEEGKENSHASAVLISLEEDAKEMIKTFLQPELDLEQARIVLHERESHRKSVVDELCSTGSYPFGEVCFLINFRGRLFKRFENNV